MISGCALACGHRLETFDIPAADNRGERRDPIVMLHEGLGSVAHWKDFPRHVAEWTSARVFVYSRHGHGESGPLEAPRDGSYLHYEAQEVLPDVLKQAGIEHPVLVGHSDGASIALLYAAAFPDNLAGLVLEAPHTFVEDVALDGIRRTAALYETGSLREKLARYHSHVDSMFAGWRDVWLDPRFRGWNIEECLGSIRCPVSIIQGADDEYGTTAQVDVILRRVPWAAADVLDGVGHTPHRDRPERVLDAIAGLTGRSIAST